MAEIVFSSIKLVNFLRFYYGRSAHAHTHTDSDYTFADSCKYVRNLSMHLESYFQVLQSPWCCRPDKWTQQKSVTYFNDSNHIRNTHRFDF